MDINIRSAVMNNLKSSDFASLKSTIEEAVNIKEEKILPGLGVMFETLWNKCGEEERNHIVNSLVGAISH